MKSLIAAFSLLIASSPAVADSYGCANNAVMMTTVEMLKSDVDPSNYIFEEPRVESVDATTGRIIYVVRANRQRGLMGFTAFKEYEVDLQASTCTDAVVTLVNDVQ